jgi:hypothetical protein
MLLNGERPRIKRDTEEGNIRQVASPGLADWETQQHGGKLSRRIRFNNWDPETETETPWGKFLTNLNDGDGGVSEREELVHAGNEDSPNKTDDPSTEGRRWHRGIVCVGNRRTDFGIWGFILKLRGRWVKIWVVVVVDSNVLSVPDR